MAISTEKLKRSIRRDTIIRITVMMDATNHLTLVSGSNYKVSIPIGATYEPVAAYQDDTSLTKSWNSSTNELTVTTLSTINDSHPVTVKFYLYLTTGQTKYLDKNDPTGAISSVAEWLPKLVTNINQREFVRDIFSGGFSVATGSSIELINDNSFFDGFFERYEDNICPFYFYNNEVKIWIGLNDSYEYIGSYIIEAISFRSNNSIQFNIKPEIKKLLSKATWGDRDEHIYATSTNYPNIKPDQDGLPIPLIFSPSVSPKLRADPDYGYPRIVYDPATDRPINQAICIDYSDSMSSSKNLTYICGRSPKALGSANKVISVSDGTTGNTVTTTGASGTRTFRKVSLTSNADLFSLAQGVPIEVNWSSTGWEVGILIYVDHQDPDLADTELWLYNSHPTETISQVRRTFPIVLWYRDPDANGNVLSTYFGAEYDSVTQTLLDSGNYLITLNMKSSSYINFNPNYEYFFTFFTDDMTVSPKELAYKFLDVVGLPHSHSDTSQKINPAFFQIPRIGEMEYSDYSDYLPDIIRPMTMSMLRLDYSTGDYEFVAMPSTIDSSNYPSTYHDITDTDIIEDSLQYSKRYDDIITRLVAYNEDIANSDSHLFSSKTYDNKRENFNYGIDNIHNINHAGLYPNKSPYSFNDINQILKTPVVRYTLSVSMKFFDVKVLDVIKVTSNRVVNNVNDGSKFVFLVVTSVEKGDENIKIEGQQVTYI